MYGSYSYTIECLQMLETVSNCRAWQQWGWCLASETPVRITAKTTAAATTAAELPLPKTPYLVYQVSSSPIGCTQILDERSPIFSLIHDCAQFSETEPRVLRKESGVIKDFCNHAIVPTGLSLPRLHRYACSPMTSQSEVRVSFLSFLDPWETIIDQV